MQISKIEYLNIFLVAVSLLAIYFVKMRNGPRECQFHYYGYDLSEHTGEPRNRTVLVYSDSLYPCGGVLDVCEPHWYWPEIFITGKADYQNMRQDTARAIADGLMGWANCSISTGLPENFGIGMTAIGEFLDHSVMPEELEKLAKERGILE